MTKYTLEAHEICTSTMELAKSWVEQSKSHSESPHVIWALEQTQGRGKLDREWISSKGNLFFTTVIPFYMDRRRVGELSFLVAVALGGAISSLNSALNISYKWPNDILISEKKVGGVLLETLSKEESLFVSIGVGLNIASFPPGLISTSLEAQGIIISPKEMLEKILKEFSYFLDVWYAEGFEPIRLRWSRKAWNKGAELRVKTFSKEIVGVFESIDHLGRLILIQEDGRRSQLFSGDVLLTRRND